MRGRAVSVYSMILLGLVPLGSLIVGSIATVLQLRTTLVLAGLLATAAALVVALGRPEVGEA